MDNFDTQGIEYDSKGKPKIDLSQEELNQAKLDKKIRNETKMLKNLKDSGNRDEKVLKQDVIKRIAVKDLDINSMFSDKNEKQLAKELVKKYLEEFVPKTISDKNNLKSVIYLEVLQYRLQNVMNELTAKGSTAIPLNLVDSIHKNLKEISANKERLGLIGVEKQEAAQDGFKNLQSIKEKFKLWREDNQGSRTLVCPCCGEMVMLKIRMNKWIPQKHPFFKDRFLANKHLIKLYLQQKLTKEDIASILDASPDYIDWLIETLWMTDPEYRKEFRKYEHKKLQELEIKLKEAEEKSKVTFDDDKDECQHTLIDDKGRCMDCNALIESGFNPQATQEKEK